MENNHQSPSQVLALDWLRGLAALMVCVFHIKKYVWGNEFPNTATRIFDYGYLGVYVFFVVSGFVIPYSMEKAGYTTGKFLRFLWKRVVRIQPPYILFLLLVWVWNFGLYQCNGWGTWSLFGIKKFLLNATYLAPFFQEKWVFSIFWTLAVEFQYYVLTGLLFVFLRDRIFGRYVFYAGMLLLNFIVPGRLETVFNHYIYFLIGFQTFLFHQNKIGRQEFYVSSLSALAFIWFFELRQAVPFVALTIAGIFLLKKKTIISSFLGNISYSLYLTHGLAGAAVAIFSIKRLDNWLRFPLAVAVSLGFAALYYVVVEKKFVRISKRIHY